MTNLETLADERQRIKTDERKLLGALSEVRSKLDTTRTELQESRKTRDELNETVRALKKTRDNLRDKAKQNITKLRTLQKTAPKLLQTVTTEHEIKQEDVRKSLNQLRGEYKDADEQYQAVRKSIDLVDKMSQRQKEETHKQNLKEAAKKKLSQGAKLSLHELSALYGEEE